jgi:ATP-dependent DNA ligase
MTREQIEARMDELARQFAATHDPEIREEIYELAMRLGEMEHCRWLRPELVAQIEFAEWTPDGHLRHSKVCRAKRLGGLRELSG